MSATRWPAVLAESTEGAVGQREHDGSEEGVKYLCMITARPWPATQAKLPSQDETGREWVFGCVRDHRPSITTRPHVIMRACSTHGRTPRIADLAPTMLPLSRGESGTPTADQGFWRGLTVARWDNGSMKGARMERETGDRERGDEGVSGGGAKGQQTAVSA